MIRIERDRVANGTWYENKAIASPHAQKNALLEVPPNPQTKIVEGMP